MVTNNQVDELRKTVASTNLGGAGFQLPRRQAELRFTGSEYDGAIVTVWLDVPMDLFLEFQGAEFVEERRLFGDHVLISWNLRSPDDPNKAIPPTADGMMQIWPTFSRLLTNEWIEAVASPPSPLSEPSSNGSIPDEASIPMEPLTANPGSFSEPR